MPRSILRLLACLAVPLAVAACGGGERDAHAEGGAPDARAEGGPFSYCDPAAAIAAYPRFATPPEVVQRLYPDGGGRDYPIVDVHTHLTTSSAEEAEIRRRAGVYAVVEATAIPDSPHYVHRWDPESTAALRARYPAPDVIQFYLGEYLKDFGEDRIPAILAKFDEHRAAGAGGIKFFKDFGLRIDDAKGARLRVDDPRLYPLWRRAAELRWTVSIHVADPDAWMTWLFWDSPYSKQNLVAQLVRVVEDNPGTVFVAIHMMNLMDSEAELDQLGAYLDRYPNLYADVAARSQDLALRDREHVRRFVIAHQDKLVYASDRTSQGVASYEEDFRYWETAGTARTFYLERSAQGLALPPHVLEKLYYKNALRAFCGALR